VFPLHAQAQERLTGTVVASWQASRDYRGAVTRAAVEEEGGTIYVATRSGIYQSKGERLERIADRSGDEGRVVLAPGGGLYAVLVPGTHAQTLFGVEVRTLPEGSAVPLRPMKEQPGGYLGVILGFRGNLIVTVAPLRNWEGTEPPFLFTFWDRDGSPRGSVLVDDHVNPVVDPSGKSLLLLGRKSASAYNGDGKLLWTREGRYRSGAISSGGSVALLNPAKDIRQVVIVRSGGEGNAVTFPTPVHQLVLPTEGSGGLVIGDRGRYFQLDLTTSRFREGRLPLRERSYIFDADYLDEKTFVFGVLHPADESLRKGWPRGTIVAVTSQGRAVFLRTFELGDAIAGEPSIDTTWRSGVFVGFTRGTTIVGRPANQ
jgi:hypothetical protein